MSRHGKPLVKILTCMVCTMAERTFIGCNFRTLWDIFANDHFHCQVRPSQHFVVLCFILILSLLPSKKNEKLTELVGRAPFNVKTKK